MDAGQTSRFLFSVSEQHEIRSEKKIKSNKIPMIENNNRLSGPGRHYSSGLVQLQLFSAYVVLSLNDRQAQSGFQTPVWLHPGALDSTDLNSSCEPVDIGRDPSFSFYFSPAAILRVNFVHASLFHRLENERSTKQKHCEVMLSLHCVCSNVCKSEQVGKHCPTIRRAWLMFHVSVVMVLF